MNYYNKLIIFFFILILPINLLEANEKTAFINVDYIIQNSNIGKKALNKIDTINKENITQLEKKNKSLREIETSIMNKKNIISENEFNKEVKVFQEKVREFTKEKNQIVENFNKFKKIEIEKIFKLFSPLITDYMKDNSINILIDSKNIFMGNIDANLTEDILKKINNKFK